MLRRPQIWQALCGTGDDKDRTEKMDLYANHLDTVETHLLQEIAARSSHFFEAAGIVQDLRGTLTRTYQQIAGLREQVPGSAILSAFRCQHAESAVPGLKGHNGQCRALQVMQSLYGLT